MKKFAIITILFALALSLTNPLLAKAAKEKPMTQEEMNKFHTSLAPALFNASWGLLEKPDRDRNDEARLINMAHASLFHWRQIGEPVNILRGEWMIAHVYTLLSHKEAALYHAENALIKAQEIDAKDWDLAYAYEAMARAHALNQNSEEFQKFYHMAVDAGKLIKEEADRNQFNADMNDENWFGMK